MIGLAPGVLSRAGINPAASDPHAFPYIGYMAAGVKAIHPGFNYAKFLGPGLLNLMPLAHEYCFDSSFGPVIQYLTGWVGRARGVAVLWVGFRLIVGAREPYLGRRRRRDLERPPQHPHAQRRFLGELQRRREQWLFRRRDLQRGSDGDLQRLHDMDGRAQPELA